MKITEEEAAHLAYCAKTSVIDMLGIDEATFLTHVTKAKEVFDSIDARKDAALVAKDLHRVLGGIGEGFVADHLLDVVSKLTNDLTNYSNNIKEREFDLALTHTDKTYSTIFELVMCDRYFPSGRRRKTLRLGPHVMWSKIRQLWHY